MKKLYTFLCVVLGVCVAMDARAATVLKPKKAAPVVKQEATTSTTNLGASMLPTALNLVQGVMTLSQQQKALTAECYPTSSELRFVNDLVKEWANAGGTNPVGDGKVPACDPAKTKASYKEAVLARAENPDNDTIKICWDVYKPDEARGAVWIGYPKVVEVEHCGDGTTTGCKTKVKSSNMWDVFAAIDFAKADFTKSEASEAEKLLEKVSRCADTKLLAKKKELVGGFITNTINNLGQTANTPTVMQSVQSIMGQKGVSGLGGLANIATTLMDR